MIRGYALVLALGVIGTAVFAGWASTTRVAYFDPRLESEPSRCDWGTVDVALPMLTDFERDWFGGTLASFGEPSLFVASLTPRESRPSSVRFLWLRSFDDVIVIRIEMDAEGTAALIAKQTSAGAGYHGGITRSLDRPLSSAEADIVRELLTSSSVLLEEPRTCYGGMDGSQWIVEATDGPSGYAFINRWSPDDGPVRDFGLALISLTGWDVGRVY